MKHSLQRYIDDLRVLNIDNDYLIVQAVPFS